MKIVLYAHGGSMNHGCEALVRSAIKAIGFEHEYILLSESPEEDKLYSLDKITSIYKSTNALPSGMGNVIYHIKAKLFDADETYYEYLYRGIEKIVTGCDIAIAIGGDNYCYKGFLERFGVMNRQMRLAKIPTALLGCSIEPAIITSKLLDDLRGYSLITARESITFKSLQEYGLSNLLLCPDTAFTLPIAEIDLDFRLIPHNTVGINISPMIMNYETTDGITIRNYENLIRYILVNTEMNVALIPHVVWKHNDDRIPMCLLYDKFKDSNRIFIQEDCNAMQLKRVISLCRFMVAARTHASIAAYSTNVPTIVVGYSVKAHGIAKDLFGTDENYVVPVESLRTPDDLRNAFSWLQKNEDKILGHYSKIVSNYIEQVKMLSTTIADVLS